VNGKVKWEGHRSSIQSYNVHGALARNRTQIVPLGRDCTIRCATGACSGYPTIKLLYWEGMDTVPSDQHELIVSLLRENQVLLQQNNDLLQKSERRERRRLIFKVVWYAMLLGVPLLAYYYLYSTFITLLGSGAEGVLVSPTVLEQLIETYRPR
jgi:hypothetical protein